MTDSKGELFEKLKERSTVKDPCRGWDWGNYDGCNFAFKLLEEAKKELFDIVCWQCSYGCTSTPSTDDCIYLRLKKWFGFVRGEP